MPLTLPKKRIIMKKNVSNTDRIIRVLIFAVALILFLTNTVTGTLGYVLVGVGSILFITSLINFCPLYHIFGINTCKIKVKS